MVKRTGSGGGAKASPGVDAAAAGIDPAGAQPTAAFGNHQTVVTGEATAHASAALVPVATPPAAAAGRGHAHHGRHHHAGAVDDLPPASAVSPDEAAQAAAGQSQEPQPAPPVPATPAPGSSAPASVPVETGGGGGGSTALLVGLGVLGVGGLAAAAAGGGGGKGSSTTTPAAPANQAPVGTGDSYTTAEDTPLTVAAAGVLANDTDADGNALSAVLVTGPAHGTLALNGNGGFVYTPAADYNGADSFTYKPNDGRVDGNTVTVALTVTPVNDAPVAVADAYTTVEDTVLTVAAAGVLANDSDVEGSPLTAVLVAGPTHGTLALNANGSFSYTPAANYSGADSFTYRANDGAASGNTVTVGLTVTAVNDAPVAVADAYTTAEDTVLTVAAAGVLGNDSDVEGSALTAVLVAGPAHGALALNADGSFSYTPAANYNGVDSFTYKPNDGAADGNTVTVSLTVTPVNDAPVAVADAYTTAEDTALTVAAAGVLANDSDVEGSALIAVLVSGPTHGTLALNANGGFVYTPAANYNGADSFTYRPNDGSATGNTVTVSLTVTPVNDPPVATADSYTTAEDTALTIAAPGVLGNDSDVDGNMLTAIVVAAPTHGALSLNADGSFLYTPAANYNGADSFTYKPNDGSADGNPVTVSLTVTPVNDAPVAVADAYTTAEDTALTVAAAGVLANDRDVEGSPLTAVLVAGPAHGTLALNADGSFLYTPAANYNGADSFAYKANDGTVSGNTVTVSLDVTPVNDAPVATADSYTTAEDTALTVPARGVLTNDTDVDGDMLAAAVVMGPAHGTLSLNGNGSFVYTPATNYNGADSFTYKPNDGTADGNTVTVSLTVTPVNDAPVATADSYTTAEDTVLTVAARGVLTNDTDVDSSVLNAVLVSGPAHGALSLNSDGSFVYTPAANYSGADSFTYKPNDGAADGNTVTVSLTVTPVNDAPVATADSYTTAEDTALTVAARGVLANDTDVDNSVLNAVLVSGPAHGTLSLNTDGSFVYTPAANYNGADSFSYKPNDGAADGNTVTVSLTVTPVNDAPVGTADSYTTAEDSALTVAARGVLTNDTDVDSSVLNAVLVSGPAHGTLSLNSDGSFVYTPAANYNGADSFSYKPNDGAADGNTVAVTLTVTPVNDAPVAVADSYTTAEDTALTVIAPGVLGNDSDPDGDPITAALVSSPSHGALSFNADGSFTYTPAGNYNGPDSFSYRVSDGTLAGNTVTVGLNVTPVNDPPVAVAENYSLVSDTTLNVAAAGVLANDTDPDLDPLTAVLVSNPSHGALTLNADGSFRYTPSAGYSGADSFTYRANDGVASSNTVTVGLTIVAANAPPVAVADSYATAEDTTLTIGAAGVLGNDSDPDNNPITAVLVSGPAHGALSLNANGGFVYTPAANFNGTDSFDYKANDGTVSGNTVTVSLTVNPVNDAPVAVADSYTTAEDTALTVPARGVLTNDTDVDGNTLTAAVVMGPAHGALSLGTDGSFVYTPAANYNGADSFTYKPNDGTVDGNTVTVTLNVTPVNDAPQGADATVTLLEDGARALVATDFGFSDPVEGNAFAGVVLTTLPTAGTLQLNGGAIAAGTFVTAAQLAANQLVYAPAANANGAGYGSLTFQVRDNGGTMNGGVDTDQSPNTLTFNVTAVNDAPTASVTPGAVAIEQTPLSLKGTLAVADVDAGAGSVTTTLSAGYGVLTLAAGTSGATIANNGTGAVTVTGTIAQINALFGTDATSAVTYTANTDTPPASTTLTLGINDNGNSGGGALTGSASTTIAITAVNDAPAGTNATLTLAEDGSRTLVQNDFGFSDVDGNAFAGAVISTLPTNGTLKLNGGAIAAGTFVTAAQLAANQLVFTPVPDGNGTPYGSFNFQVRDDGGTANGGVDTDQSPNTITFNVTPVNDAPVANNDTGTANEDTPLTVTAANGLLANDTDVDGPSLSVASVTGGTLGTPFALASGALLTVNANGSYTYNPNGKFEVLRPGQTATDSFSYTATDGTATSNTATATITIQGANEAPVGVNDTYSGIVGNTPISYAAAQGVLVNDTDPDQPASALTVTQVNGSAIGGPVAVTGGSVSMNTDGSFTFTPATGFQGAASFTYTVRDADGGTSTATATLNVGGAAGQIWYVDSSASASGADGSYLHPFTSLAPLSIAGDPDGNGDTIFVYNRGVAYTSGIALEAGQKLYGDAHEFTVNGIAIGASGVTTNSTVAATSGNVVTLATDNMLDGLTLNANGVGVVGLADGGGSVTTTGGTFTATQLTLTGSGQAIDIDQGGNLNVTIASLTSSGSTANGIQLAGSAASGTGLITGTVNIAAGSISGAVGPAFLIGVGGGATDNSGGNVNVTYAGTVSGNTGRAVEIEDRTGGTLTLSGNITHAAASTGILVDGSGDGAVNFTGQSIQISSGAATGVQLSNNSSPSVINFNPAAGGNGLDITTVSGTGFSVSNSALSVTGSGNTVTTATGNIVDLQSAVIGAAGVTFATLQDTGVAVGGTNTGAINLNNVTGTGAFAGGVATIAGTSGSTSAQGIRISGGTAAIGLTSATVGNTAGDGISITTAGAVTIGSVQIDNTTGNGVKLTSQNNAVAINGGSIGATNDPTGDALNITGGTGAVTVGANISKTTIGNVVEINTHATGAINLSGTISATGGVNDGILVTGNTSGATTFSGNVTASTGGSTALNVSNNTGGSVTFSGTSKALSTTSGTAIDFTDTATTGANLSFTNGGLVVSSATGNGINATNSNGAGAPIGMLSISGTGNTVNAGFAAVNINNVGEAVTLQSVTRPASITGAIYINNAGSSVGTNFFQITGTGAAGSGGTLTGAAGGTEGVNFQGVGIYLGKVSGVDLSSINVAGTYNNYGIHGDTVTNFALRNSTVSGSFGNTSTGGSEEGAVRFDGLLGTATITGNTIAGGYTNNLRVVNTTGTLDRATVQTNTFGLLNATGGDDNVTLQVGVNATDNGTLKVSLLGNTFLGTRGDFIETVANGNTTLESVVRNNIFQNGQTTVPGGGTGVSIRSGSGGNTTAATTTFDIAGNQLNTGGTNAFDTVGIFVAKGQDNGTLSGTIQNNSIGPAKTGSSADGIFVRSNGGGSTTVLIQNNTVSGYTNAGIHLQNNDGSGTMNATLYGNTTTGTGFAFAGLFADNGGTATDTNKLNLLVGSATNAALKNNFSAGDPANGSDVSLSNLAGSTFNLSKGGSTAITASQVILDDNLNPGTTTVPTPSGTITLVGTNPTLPNTLPLLASASEGTIHATTHDGIVSQADVNLLVAAAIQHWADAGATAEQLAIMRAVTVSVADLTDGQIGGARAGFIQVDSDGAGHGWFVDTTPNDNAEFAGPGTRLTATQGGGAEGRLDLLTVITHELGHQIGLGDLSGAGDRADLMFDNLDMGERRLPAATDVAQAANPVAASDALDLSGLASIVQPHAPAEAAQGWRAAVAATMDFGADHSLDALLAHLGGGAPAAPSVAVGDIGHGFDHVYGGGFGDHGGLTDMPQIEIRPDMFGQLDHSVL